ncbi:methyltransferase domain-containing protein [Streptomyces nitrosporeus]|uniref:Methyltransferase domain-containing protein n=1 Tax=Streptomyces nitrosporeus TaxID=28894 RepID=A0A5J6FI39_9ACTN|nr:class I SAM-dependent methyltransferase [Streptomyces nitrosporeus]QEU76269.1 methyltransferase domain-containing protein [Streptomyces nitrosporeus]
MFEELSVLNTRPPVYSQVTTPDLWTDPHISARMLAAHLDPHVDLSSYRAEHLEKIAAWIISRFHVRPGLRVADFGCGPGLYTTRLARTGADVTGLDLSSRSLDHAESLARADGLSVRYLEQDYLSYRDEARYDLVIMVMRDYCALTPDGRRALLRTVRAHLDSGGSFAFDVDSAAAMAGVREQAAYAPSLMDGFWSDRPYFGFHNTYRYESERVSLDKFEIFETDRTRTYFNWVRYFTPDELTGDLVDAGFADVEILGDLTGAPTAARHRSSPPSPSTAEGRRARAVRSPPVPRPGRARRWTPPSGPSSGLRHEAPQAARARGHGLRIAAIRPTPGRLSALARRGSVYPASVRCRPAPEFDSVRNTCVRKA